MDQEKHLYLEMSWDEIKNSIEKNKILFFIVGSVEQHGFHLPVGTDTIPPMEIALRVAKKVGGVVAPSTTYGYKSILKSGGGPHYPGSVGVKGATLIYMIRDIFSVFIEQGWRKFLIFDWHEENRGFTFEGIDEAVKASGLDATQLKIVRIENPCDLALREHPELYDILFGNKYEGMTVEHASTFETSVMMAIRPDLVKQEKIVDGRPPIPMDYDVLPVPLDAAPESGVFWKPKSIPSTPEKGIKFVDALIETLINVINKEFN